MSKWLVLYKKEWLEIIRSYKLIWVPVVFILLGAMQPVTTYFLPDILANAGNLPNGTVLEIPTPHASDVLAQTLQQFSTLGLLVVALSFMGTLSGERISGMASMILVKPVSYLSFISSKWAAMLSLALLSFTAGYGAAWYYTVSLFQSVNSQWVIRSFIIFAFWLVFVGTLTIWFSSLLRSAAAAAFSALAVAAVFALTASLLPNLFQWSPGNLPQLALAQLTGQSSKEIWPSLGITALLTAGLVIGAAWILRRQPASDAV